ncbi:hypothetical protein ACTNDY_05580 [Tissierellaceae bacterium HCP3S3_D8]
MKFKKTLCLYIRIFIFMNLGLLTGILTSKKSFDLSSIIFASVVLPAISTLVLYRDKVKITKKQD